MTVKSRLDKSKVQGSTLKTINKIFFLNIGYTIINLVNNSYKVLSSDGIELVLLSRKNYYFLYYYTNNKGYIIYPKLNLFYLKVTFNLYLFVLYTIYFQSLSSNGTRHCICMTVKLSLDKSKVQGSILTQSWRFNFCFCFNQ